MKTIIIEIESKKHRFIIKPAYYDYLLRTIIVVTVLGSQTDIFQKKSKN